MSDFPEADLEAAARPRLKGGPIKPGQYLLNKRQLLELCGDPAFSTVWLWMKDAGFPKPLVMGPPEGRTSRVCWIASEVFDWLKSRPRRAIGHLKQNREAPETGKPAAVRRQVVKPVESKRLAKPMRRRPPREKDAAG